jgi:hypothetical protein
MNHGEGQVHQDFGSGESGSNHGEGQVHQDFGSGESGSNQRSAA